MATGVADPRAADSGCSQPRPRCEVRLRRSTRDDRQPPTTSARTPVADAKRCVELRRADLRQARPVPRVPLHALALGGGGGGDGDARRSASSSARPTSQIAQSAGLTSIVLEEPAAAPRRRGEPAESAAPRKPPPRRNRRPALPDRRSQLPLIPEPPAEEPAAGSGARTGTAARNCEEEETLPPVKHVFLIVLGENSYEEAFGATSPAPYLAKTLAEQRRAALQLLRGHQGRAGQPDRPAQRPGADRRNRPRTAPTTPTSRPATVSVTDRSKAAAASIPAGDRNAAGPAGGKGTELEGLRRGPRRSLRAAAEALDCDPFVYFHSLLDEPRMRRDTTSASTSWRPT